MAKTSIERVNEIIDRFNDKIPTGTTITLLDDDKNEFQGVVSHGAFMLGGHTAVVYLQGKGAYLLERVVTEY